MNNNTAQYALFAIKTLASQFKVQALSALFKVFNLKSMSPPVEINRVIGTLESRVFIIGVTQATPTCTIRAEGKQQ